MSGASRFALNQRRIVAPALEDVLSCLRDDIYPVVLSNIEERLRRLYGV